MNTPPIDVSSSDPVSSGAAAPTGLIDAAIIDSAAVRLEPVVARTPLERCDRLSRLHNADVWLKREDLQPVRSYKLRGAFNVIAQLTAAQRAAGVVAASAGNHAQGVAFACRMLRIQCRIYVPTTTPKQKRDRIRWHGGEYVTLLAVGATYDAAAEAALADAAETGAAIVHAFDNPEVAAGQGTIAKEFLEQLGSDPDIVVVPVGGGGALSGIGSYVRARSPRTALVAAEPSGAPSLNYALSVGERLSLDSVDPFVDGAAVGRIGQVAFDFATALAPALTPHPQLPETARQEQAPGPLGAGAALVTHVDEGAICTAMLDLYQNEGIIAEPAGALAVAALEVIDIPVGATVVCLVSGGNNDVSRYGEIIERSLVHRGLKHYFLVDFPQEPGSLRRFLDNVLGPDDDITLFEYVKRNNRDLGAAVVGIELGAVEGLAGLLERMQQSFAKCERLEPGTAAYRYLT